MELPRDLPFHVTETGAHWAYTTREDAGTRVLTLEVPPTPALELDEPDSPEDFPWAFALLANKDQSKPMA